MARSVGGNAAYTLVAQVGSTILGLSTSIITARVLGPSARGIFTLVTTLPHTLSAMVKLGLAQGAVYAIRKNKVAPSKVASHLAITAVGLSGPVVLGAIFFREQMASGFMKGAEPIYLILGLPLVPLLLIESYFYAVLQGLEYFRLANHRVIVSSLLAPSTMFIALVLCGGGLRAAILTNLALVVAMDVWLIATVFSLAPFRWQWDWRFAEQMLKFGVKSHLQILAQHLHMRIDVYIIAAFLTPADVAFYAIATRLAELVFNVPESLGMVVYPRQAGSSKQRVEDLTATACRHTIFVTSVAAVGLVTIGPWLIRLWYGAAYAPVAAPLPYLVVGVIMMSVFFMFTRNFTSQNRQEVNLLSSVVALGGNFGLNIVLVPRMGIAGAGLSSAISYSLGAAILASIYFRESGKRVRDVVVLQRSDVAEYRRLVQSAASRWLPKSATGPA
ncbi:MAG TPA: oligosaccharide flippase family protein [Candidatus Binatia bacterium]|nr:oligosaccharide flippase family protein [Candidatus Binatia bacterium]